MKTNAELMKRATSNALTLCLLQGVMSVMMLSQGSLIGLINIVGFAFNLNDYNNFKQSIKSEEQSVKKEN